jgi:beta-glucanase (GH16 family)
VYAGKLGSSIGQHKINSACVVREEQQNRSTYLPMYGYFEIKMKAVNTPSNVAALWMIGYEDEPHRNAEICIVEIKGHQVKKQEAIIGYGIRKFDDPQLTDAFYEERFAIDVMQFNVYAARWTNNSVSFYINHQLVREIEQSPQYPMQLMLGLYEVPVKRKLKRDTVYPKEFVVDYVRGYAI